MWCRRTQYDNKKLCIAIWENMVTYPEDTYHPDEKRGMTIIAK